MSVIAGISSTDSFLQETNLWKTQTSYPEFQTAACSLPRRFNQVLDSVFGRTVPYSSLGGTPSARRGFCAFGGSPVAAERMNEA